MKGALNYRNAATVGGTVAGAATDSEFYAALLALGASLSTTAGDAPLPLASLTHVEGIITAIHVPMENARSGMARVARTPADRPIVAAIAVASGDTTRVALCGVADRPILAGTDAPSFADFRGSAEYRQAMAAILRERALAEAKAA